jgi:hypothetical protein
LADVDVHSVTIPFHAKKPSPHNSLPKRIRGVGGGGGYQKEHCLAGEFSRFFADQIFQKVGGIKIILAPSFAHFLPTLLSLQVAKFFQGKPKILPPIRFQKRWPCSLHSFGLTDMQVMTLSKSILEKTARILF